MSHYLNSNHYGLTPRETDILMALAHAELAKQTANRLGISEGSVESVRWSMCRRMQVRTSLAAVCKAFREGIIPLDKGLSDMGEAS